MNTEDYAQKIVDLVKAVVEAEREACAQIADERAGGQAFKRGAAVRIAEAIRARAK